MGVSKTSSRGAIKNKLQSYGFKQSPLQCHGPLISVAAVAVAALFAWITIEVYGWSGGLDGTTKLDGTEFSTAIVAVGAFFIGYWQWRAARFEVSMDKFYERLHIANEYQREVKNMPSRLMHVFSELDNLEYMVEKYKLGYIPPEYAFRALNTFWTRCAASDTPTFRCDVKYWVKESGYDASTVAVVERVCRDFADEESP